MDHDAAQRGPVKGKLASLVTSVTLDRPTLRG
jgi:hypothetical protein